MTRIDQTILNEGIAATPVVAVPVPVTLREFDKETSSTISSSSTFTSTSPVLIEPTPSPILARLSPNQLITIAGAASGFLAGVAVCPLDVVKTRLQAQGDAIAYMPSKYNGFSHTFKTILTEEGIRGLYRGLVPITIGYLPTWTIYFTMYEKGKRVFPNILHKYLNVHNDDATHFFSALTAGLTSSVVVNPIWVVKTRLMIQTGKKSTIYGSSKKVGRTYYKGTIDAFRKMYREEGIRVFYSGLLPSIFGLLHVGIHFPMYEKFKSILNCNMTEGNDTKGILLRLVIASSTSKMIASTITYPHEILRTRMQIKNHGPGLAAGRQVKHVLVQSTIDIWKKEGWRGFYAGYGTNLARTVPSSAVTLVSFEYFKTYLLRASGHSPRLK
ncbi:Mitochondrial nicotinamide adenine dinucleotide transporter 1 [Spathaspora sp. JA1]|nr:Mitochondrial nicotinamide adenine dinucleotide transporter 1 [Spathaspora sp. JA1]